MQAKIFRSFVTKAVLAAMSCLFAAPVFAAGTKVSCTIETFGERTDYTQSYVRMSDPKVGPLSFDLDDVYGYKISVTINYATSTNPSSIQTVCAGKDSGAVCSSTDSLLLYPSEEYGGQVGDQAVVKCETSEVP